MEFSVLTSSISSQRMLIRAYRRLPVTFVMIMVSCFLYALTLYIYLFESDPNAQSTHPGSLDILILTDFPDIYGMISLWEGDWWRLTVSAFHHGNLLHLMMNVMAFWMFADLLEPKLGKLRYLLFCLLGATISILPEAALDQPAVGISGMVFALFGLLLIVRRHDDDIAERIHPFLVPWCFAWLFFCIPLDLYFGVPIANGGHLIGTVYGAIVGWLCYDLRLKNRFAGYAGLMVIHLGLITGVFYLMQPTWNGRYIAWRAITETQSIADWERAIELEPSLETGWRYLAEHYVSTGDRHRAWLTVLKGAKLNRSSTKLNELARYVWRRFDSATDRATALDEVQRIFGDETDAWIERFELPLPGGVTPTQLAELPFPDMPSQTSLRLDDLLDVPAQVSGITRPLPAEVPPGSVDPDDPESARLGVTL